MSNAATAMFTRSAAIERADYGIRVNNLARGAILTDMNRALIEEIGADRFRQWNPAGRVGTVNELVGRAVFVARDASSKVTGGTLTADGGYQQHLVRYRAAMDA